MIVYARYEYPERYQELGEHLRGTSVKVEKLLQTRIVRHVIDQLAQPIRIDPSEVIEAAKTAAVFHDIGKALHHYQKQAYEITKEGSGKYMSFILHELISANLYAQTICIHLNQKLQYPYSNPWLASLTIQTILLHHQGLRTITIEKLYSNITNNIIANNPLNSIRNIRSVIEDISMRVNCRIAETLLNILEQNINSIIQYYNPSLIQQLYRLEDTIQIEISRIITGCLMIADTWDAYEAMRGRASRYVQDIIHYLRTLGLSIYDS